MAVRSYVHHFPTPGPGKKGFSGNVHDAREKHSPYLYNFNAHDDGNSLKGFDMKNPHRHWSFWYFFISILLPQITLFFELAGLVDRAGWPGWSELGWLRVDSINFQNGMEHERLGPGTGGVK